MKPRLTPQDIAQAAQRSGVEAAALKAVIAVESAGGGFLKDGRCKILLERHILWKRLKWPGRDVDPKPLAQDHPELCGPTWDPKRFPYGSTAGQWDRFAAVQEWARKRDPSRIQSYLKATIEACSWGLFQVLGENYGLCGCSNALEFRTAMERSESDQLQLSIHMMAQNRALTALRERNWKQFAEIWNGPGQVPFYAGRLEKAYHKAAG